MYHNSDTRYLLYIWLDSTYMLPSRIFFKVLIFTWQIELILLFIFTYKFYVWAEWTEVLWKHILSSFYNKISHTDYNIKCLNTVYPIYDNFLVQPIKKIFGLKLFFYLVYGFYTSFINFVTFVLYNFCNIDLLFIYKRY